MIEDNDRTRENVVKDIDLFDYRLKCRRIGGSVYVKVPSNFCKSYGIKGINEEIRVIIHQVITLKDIKNLCIVYKK